MIGSHIQFDPRFAAIQSKAKEKGLPRHYHADLETHDRNILLNNPEITRFYWVLREMGTHLVSVETREEYDYLEACTKGERYLYVWEEGKLHNYENQPTLFLHHAFERLPHSEQNMRKRRPNYTFNPGVQEIVDDIRIHGTEEGVREEFENAWHQFIYSGWESYYTQNVQVYPDSMPWSFFWQLHEYGRKNRRDNPQLVGGLIYHPDIREWRMHT